MRRSAILAIACLVALAAPATHAFAAGNGMLAAVTADNKVVTLNPDGSGLNTVWDQPTGPITGLAWSPDGNKLALIAGGKLVVRELATGKLTSLPEADTSDPTWSSDGTSIGVRRGNDAVKIKADLTTQQKVVENLPADAFAWSPNLIDYAYRVGPLLYLKDVGLELESSTASTLSFSRDGQALAFVSTKPISPADQPGVYVRTPIGQGGGSPQLVAAGGDVGTPRWAPDRSALLYRAGAGWKTVPATGGAGTAIAGTAGAPLADWQPCVPGTTNSCTSYAPPHCDVVAQTMTTQADQPKDLPANDSCRDPVSLGLSLVVVTPPAHGRLVGLRYTPDPGFIGEDAVTYRMSNGSGLSEPVTVKIFVVPRPAATVVVPSPTPAAPRAPFLTARATPRLSRKRTTLVKLECDQSCTFAVRLTGHLKKARKSRKKTVKGSVVRRSLPGHHVLSLRLRLPSKPKGTLKTVWILGTVRNAAGESRPVKLPVRVPR
jgi:hypothetical protein